MKNNQRELIRINNCYYKEEKWSGDESEKMPVIYIKGRNKQNSYREIKVTDFRPFFYVPKGEWEMKRSDINDSRILSVETGYKSLKDTELVKITCELPRHVPDIRSNFSETFEADVLFYLRFLISKDILTHLYIPKEDGEIPDEIDHRKLSSPDESDIDFNVKPRICYIDIEVETDNEGFPDIVEANNPVTIITIQDSYKLKYKAFILKHENWAEKEEKKIKDFFDRKDLVKIEIITDNEKELLEKLNRFISEKNFDLISGWNSDGFDIPYLINRCHELNIENIELWTRENGSRIDDDEPERMIDVYMQRTVPFDILKGYKKLQYGDLKSYSLEYVAQKEGVSEKLQHTLSIDDLREYKPIEFIKYNIRDVIAVQEINDKVGVLDVYENIRDVTGGLHTDVHFNRNIIDSFFLRKAKEQDIKLPSSSKPDRSWYYGAHVFDPEGGVHKNVTYPDLKSLYPYTMWSLNLSPETAIGTKENLENSKYSEEDCLWGYVDNRPIKYIQKGEKRDKYKNGEYKSIILETERGNQTVWADKPKYEKFYYLKPEVKTGFAREAITELIDLKYQFTGTKYEAVKRVTNCFTPDTEALTPNGVKNIKELKEGDTVYSLDPDTLTVEEKNITDVWRYPEYSGEILDIETEKIDFNITPNHKVLAKEEKRNQKNNSYSFTEAGNLKNDIEYQLPNNWNSKGEKKKKIDLTKWLKKDEYKVFIQPKENNLETYNIDIDNKKENISNREGIVLDGEKYEKNKNILDKNSSDVYIYDGNEDGLIKKDVDCNVLIEFFGLYLNGDIITKPKNKLSKDAKNSSGITLQKQDRMEIISIDQKNTKELLDSLGVRYYKNDKGYILYSGVFTKILDRLCGSNNETKKIPRFVWSLNQEQKELLLKILTNNKKISNVEYKTVSDRFRDDLLKLCVHTGLNPAYKWENGFWKIEASDNINRVNPKKDVVKSEPENGVYCVTVKDNHNLIAGRNGKFQWIGQSTYGVFGFSTQNTAFRLFDWRLAESVTLVGRKVIEETADKFVDELKNKGYEAYLVSGDTDSCQTSIPEASVNESVDVSKKILEEINNKYYDKYAEEEFGMDEHRFEVELEKVAERFFILSETKKRYAEYISWKEDKGFLDENGKEISITGFEATRSDTADLSEKLQRQVLEIILTNPIEKAKDNVYDLIENYSEKIKNGEVDLEEIGIREGLSKPPDKYGTENRSASPAKRGAKYINQVIEEENITTGDKPMLFYVKGVKNGLPKIYKTDTAENGDPVDAVSVKNIETLENFDIDYKKMEDKILREPIEPILKELGWTYGNAVKGHRQQNFDSFM